MSKVARLQNLMTVTGTSCQTCKDRRIKCDGAKPACQRCSRSKRICIPVSNTKQPSFSIHDENSYASGATKRPRGPRSNLVTPQPVNLETKAVAYYLQYHLRVVPNTPITLNGLSECVVTWKCSGRKDDMVDLALSAMALTVYANMHNDPQADTEGSHKYCELLQLAQERIAKVELQSLTGEDIDACLLTIFLMGRYETQMHHIVCPNPSMTCHTSKSWSHHEGGMAMLKVWHDTLRQSAVSNIVKHTRRGQIRSAILRSRVLPNWLLDGADFGEEGLELEYDHIIIRIILLRQSLACCQQKGGIRKEDIQQLDRQAEDIIQTLEHWINRMDCPKSEHEHPQSDSLPRLHLYSRTIYSTQHLGHAAIWTQYFSARILLGSTQCRILELGDPNLLDYCTYQGRRWVCFQDVKNMAEGLASMVPFCLDRFTVTNSNVSSKEHTVVLNKDEDIKPHLINLLVWPLTIASSISEVDFEMQTWFKSELSSLGELVGDYVIAGAKTEKWSIVL